MNIRSLFYANAPAPTWDGSLASLPRQHERARELFKRNVKAARIDYAGNSLGNVMISVPPNALVHLQVNVLEDCARYLETDVTAHIGRTAEERKIIRLCASGILARYELR